MDEGGDVGKLGRGEIELGHAGAAFGGDLSDELAVLIVENEFGADQAGSAFLPPRASWPWQKAQFAP